MSSVDKGLKEISDFEKRHNLADTALSAIIKDIIEERQSNQTKKINF